MADTLIRRALLLGSVAGLVLGDGQTPVLATDGSLSNSMDMTGIASQLIPSSTAAIYSTLSSSQSTHPTPSTANIPGPSPIAARPEDPQTSLHIPSESPESRVGLETSQATFLVPTGFLGSSARVESSQPTIIVPLSTQTFNAPYVEATVSTPRFVGTGAHLTAHLESTALSLVVPAPTPSNRMPYIESSIPAPVALTPSTESSLAVPQITDPPDSNNVYVTSTVKSWLYVPFLTVPSCIGCVFEIPHFEQAESKLDIPAGIVFPTTFESLATTPTPQIPAAPVTLAHTFSSGNSPQNGDNVSRTVTVAPAVAVTAVHAPNGLEIPTAIPGHDSSGSAQQQPSQPQNQQPQAQQQGSNQSPVYLPIPGQPPALTISMPGLAPQTIQPNNAGAYIISTPNGPRTLTPGGSITFTSPNGPTQTLSLQSSPPGVDNPLGGLVLNQNGQTTTFTASGLAATPAPNGGLILPNGVTVLPGGTAVVNGQTVVLPSASAASTPGEGQVVVINGVTSTLSPKPTTTGSSALQHQAGGGNGNGNTLTLPGGAVATVNSDGSIIISGTTIQPGQTSIVSGTTIGVPAATGTGSGGDVLINGSTFSIPNVAPSTTGGMNARPTTVATSTSASASPSATGGLDRGGGDASGGGGTSGSSSLRFELKAVGLLGSVFSIGLGLVVL